MSLTSVHNRELGNENAWSKQTSSTPLPHTGKNEVTFGFRQLEHFQALGDVGRLGGCSANVAALT